MTPQRAHAERRKADGSKRLTVWLELATVAALAQLRARATAEGRKASDASIVNHAVVALEEATR